MAWTLGQCSRGRDRCDLGLQSTQCWQMFIQTRAYVLLVQNGHSAWRHDSFKIKLEPEHEEPVHMNTLWSQTKKSAWTPDEWSMVEKWTRKCEKKSDKEDHLLKTFDFIFSSQLSNIWSLSGADSSFPFLSSLLLWLCPCCVWNEWMCSK